MCFFFYVFFPFLQSERYNRFLVAKVIYTEYNIYSYNNNCFRSKYRENTASNGSRSRVSIIAGLLSICELDFKFRNSNNINNVISWMLKTVGPRDRYKRRRLRLFILVGCFSLGHLLVSPDLSLAHIAPACVFYSRLGKYISIIVIK